MNLLDKSLPLFEGYCLKNQIDGKDITASISGHPIKLKVASSEDTQRKGLMGSSEPGYNEGMIFIYDVDDELQFWMKNVKFKLDIIFFDSKLNYINSFTMDEYDGSPDPDIKRYSSNGAAMYAVELKAGWINKFLDKDDCKLVF